MKGAGCWGGAPAPSISCIFQPGWRSLGWTGVPGPGGALCTRCRSESLVMPGLGQAWAWGRGGPPPRQGSAPQAPTRAPSSLGFVGSVDAPRAGARPRATCCASTSPRLAQLILVPQGLGGQPDAFLCALGDSSLEFRVGAPTASAELVFQGLAPPSCAADLGRSAVDG